MEGLLNRDVPKRLGAGADGFAELKDHEFFEDFSWDGLLARQVEPPFLPQGETYAEDQEEGGMKILNTSAACEDDDGGDDADWVDPDPKWQEEFK